MTRLPFDRYALPRRRTAALTAAAAIALATGLTLITTSGGARSRPARSASAKQAPRAGASFPDTRAGAVAAATAWCQNIGAAFYDGTLNSVASTLATPAFRSRVQRGQPASQMVHSRLTAPGAPAYAERQWPLGYAVEQYSPAAARVRVWQLFVLEVARPSHSVAYASTTIWLQWTDGDWKVAGSRWGPDLTPPGNNATADQAAAWINGIDQLHGYAYAP